MDRKKNWWRNSPETGISTDFQVHRPKKICRSRFHRKFHHQRTGGKSLDSTHWGNFLYISHELHGSNLQERLLVAANDSLSFFWWLDLQLRSRYLFAWRHLAINSDRLLTISSLLGKYNISDFFVEA